MPVKIVSVTELIGKDLFTKARANIRRYNDVHSPILRTTKAGDRVGKIYSYSLDKLTGEVWWNLYEDNGAGIYNSWIKHDSKYLDYKTLKQQGVKTVEEIEKEKQELLDKENETWYGNLFKDFKSGLKTTLIVGVSAYVVVNIASALINKKQISQ